MTETAPDDSELATRARSGDSGALSLLVRRYQGAMLRFARSLIRGESLAEEVVQETWLAVVDGVERFEGRCAFKTWLFRILTNRAATKATKEARSVPLSSVSNDPEPAVPPEKFLAGFWRKAPSRWTDPSVENRVQDLQIRRLVEQALDALPESQRAVVVLRDVEGVDAAEVCGILGISEANQRVLLHRGRSRLRALINARLPERAGGAA